MGLFNFLKHKEKEVILYSPLNGVVTPLEEVPDPAFSERMMGDGMAINPTDSGTIVVGNINSDGVLSIFSTGHAFTLEIEKLEVLVHLGIETVSLKGKGFSVLVESEKKYPVDCDILTIDENTVQPHVPSLLCPIVVPNMDVVENLEILVPLHSTVEKGTPLMKVLLKN